MTALLPDIIARDLDVIFCGLNPGMTAAISGHHFSSASNRFWRVLHLAGFTPTQIRPENDRSILEFGCGLTTVVTRPTRRADEVSSHEFVQASAAFTRKIRRFRPRAVAFLGKAAYAAIAGQPLIQWGKQHELFGGAMAWVVPNPSGLNRNFREADLVEAYRALRLGAIEASDNS